MKLKMVVSLLFSLVISFVFLIETTSVEAAPCPPGNYQYYDQGVNVAGKNHADTINVTFSCKSVDGNNEEDGTNGLSFDNENGDTWARNLFTFLVQLSVVVGYASEVVAMLVIAYAAFLYTTSEGDPKKVRMAKMYVLFAFTGMFIGAFSLIISRFIGGALG